MDFDELNRISNSPARVIPSIFNDIEKTFDQGFGTLNGSGHPFAYAIDLIVGTNFNLISRLGDTEARTYPVHARNISDLAKVMSDEDWYGVFADPSETGVRFIISEESLDRFSVRYDNVDGTLDNSYRKLVIPADTQIMIADIPFLLENPVEIRVMDHGGYQVVYDSTRQSPFKPLSSNTPEVDYLNIDGRQYLAIHLPIRQLLITEFPNRAVNEVAGFREQIQFTDSLYAVRAWLVPEGSNVRTEMSVVYNNDIFDPTFPTLTIDLEDTNGTTDLGTGSFTASLPSVYTQNGLGIGRITILIYTTKGAYYRDLTTLKSQYHTAAYYNYANDKGKLNIYEAPFRTIGEGVVIDSIAPITGGRNALTFPELKTRQIYGYRKRLIPVSNTDVSEFLLSNGYSSIKSIDQVTSRLYRVTKNLPLQDNKLYQDDSVTRFNSSMGTHVGSILTSLEQLIGSGWGIDNGRRVTIPARSAFDITQQTPAIIPRNDYNTLMGLSNQGKIDALTNKTLCYNPFAYVIDTTQSRASCRIYRLNKPDIRYQTFRWENVNLGVQVGVGAINIKSTQFTYEIDIETQSSDDYKKLDDDIVGIQLSLTPIGTTSPATMRAEYRGRTEKGERLFRFVIPTRYDVDSNNQIDLGGFNQFGRPQVTTYIDLSTTANFIFTYSGNNQQLRSESDMKVDQTLFSTTTIAMVDTDYALELGRQLKSMYTRIRPVTGPAMYRKYDVDIPSIYEQTEYEYETVIVNGKPMQQLKIDPVTGLPIITHKKGDQVFTPEGKPVYKFLKGQTVYDTEGNPVLLEPRKMLYYWDFIGFDFNYIVSQDDYDTIYMDRVDDFFVDEVVAQLDEFNKITLDETKLVFKPRSTMGFTRCIINEAVERMLKTDLSFSITYSLTREGLRNQNLKDNLGISTHRLINTELMDETVSLSEIIQSLKDAGGSDVIDVQVKATSGTTGIEIVTNVDNTNGFSVRKVLEQTADRFLTIKEDIDIQFKRHMPENLSK